MTFDRSIGPRCNIGPAEVARRRKSALVFTVVAALVAVGLVTAAVPAPVRVALFPFAAAAGVNWMQVVHRFCVGFAALGLENLGELGSEIRVDPAQRAIDRRRAVQVVLEGSLIGALATVAFVAVSFSVLR